MKRFWLGILLLAVLLAGGLFLSQWADHTFSRLSQHMETACQLAAQEQLWQAEPVVSHVYNRWLECRNATAALADHTPMEEIDRLFGELNIYGQKREFVHYAATCAQLATALQAMADSQSLSWWHLL